MKKNKRILAFVLCMILLFQTGFGSEAAEIESSDTIEGEQPEDKGEEEDGYLSSDEETDQEMQEYIRAAREELNALTSQENLMALIYLCDTYEVKNTPDSAGTTVVEVPSGTTAFLKGVGLDADYNIWYQVSLEYNGNTYAGYIERSYLAYSNEHFIEWENNYFPQIATFAMESNNYLDVEQFPGSYQQKLMALKRSHPNWIFVRQNTGLDWQKVVNNENDRDRSLINGSMGKAYRGDYYGSGWYYASEEAVKYYLDPRNFLTETRVFQFEQLTYNDSYHTQPAVQNILNNTFMKGTMPGAGMTYAEAFFQIGASLKVSPFHLACRVYQEQGEGTSALISGTYSTVPEYRGYYNYFNISAAGSTTKQIVESGLAKAVAMGWNTPYASIKGGAEIISRNYILRGQDTLYLQKFDVDVSDGTLYTHQYMQNIMAPYTESSMVKGAYGRTGALDSPFVFKIPVYNHMPSEACPVPGQGTSATPTAKASETPSATPTAKATEAPTVSVTPSETPGVTPTAKASETPSVTPTAKASETPSAAPTAKASETPSAAPTAKATKTPSAAPIAKASETPTAASTAKASETPSAAPTAKATKTPTVAPTVKASETPSAAPTAKASETPSAAPTAKASETPTVAPTAKASETPTVAPTAKASETPTAAPTAKASETPSIMPSATPKVTAAPTAKTTTTPTAKATEAPTSKSAEDPQETPSSGETVQAVQTPVAVNSESPEEIGAASEPTAANIEENTNSDGVTVAAVTPKPQTMAEDKDVLIMDMSKTGIIYAQTLQQIREQGREVIFEMDDQISWRIDGNTIESDTPEDINLNVSLGSSQIPEWMLDILVENENYIELSLSHEGEFGFTAVLSVQLDGAQPGQYANLFYYNEETNDFEFMCASLIDSKCIAEFEFKHASDYVIMISDETKENLLETKALEIEEAKAHAVEVMAQAKEELPAKEPGKAAAIIAIILLASAAMGIGTYLIFKRSDDES